ncbi:DUF4440 domain-containing protein [Aquiflexum sp.]|uniref:DUF4440 domain-containing protein n=1 Tax=Aquiflexum sp. TaxID=1872584 RepID=UPI003593EB29
MKPYLIIIILFFSTLSFLFAQDDQSMHRNAIIELIDNYSKAREKQDTLLLKELLMPNIDQLVSSGEWRIGIQSAIEGMQRSSNANKGKRTLAVDRIKFLTDEVAVGDAKYIIENLQGGKREMWSTFVVVFTDNGWKISAIRNMLPTQ